MPTVVEGRLVADALGIIAGKSIAADTDMVAGTGLGLLLRMSQAVWNARLTRSCCTYYE